MGGSTLAQDGIHGLAPREAWTVSARKRREAYAITPGAALLRTEFGFYCLDAWREQGFPKDVKPREYADFLYEPDGHFGLWGLGWCEPPYVPAFEVKVLEDRGETEVEQDFAGRQVLYFKGRRSGFMPEYVGHPVKDLVTWEKNAAWRLDPADPRRLKQEEANRAEAKKAAAKGLMITQHLAGSFMYLRSMIGPEEVLYAFHDQPKLIEAAMQRWLEVADRVTAYHQGGGQEGEEGVTLDEIFFAEDNCYNHGPLIAPEMMKSMLWPYYKELIRRVKSRQKDKSRHLYLQIDTDGDCRPLIPLYMEEIGMDSMSPFEVASGCDVVAIGKEYPKLMMRGGIDKRVLARGKKAIDEMLERIIPAMRARGGYIPCCDHGVPAEVRLEDYLHYRRRCVELGG